MSWTVDRDRCLRQPVSHGKRGPRRRPQPSGRAGRARGPRPGAALPAGLDPVKLMVDGEHFVVTRRPGSPGTYDFDWTSHPESYGFTVGANSEWRPDRTELTEEIRSFLSQVDKETGYLRG